MYRRVRIFECENGPGPRRTETKKLIWAPWADVQTYAAKTKSQSQEILREGEIALELRRCEKANEIRRHVFRHDKSYRVEMDGEEFEVQTADFARNDRAKIRITASYTV